MIQIPDKVPDKIKKKIRKLLGEKVAVERLDFAMADVGYITEYDERLGSIRISKSKDDPEHGWSMFYAGWIKSIKKARENAG